MDLQQKIERKDFLKNLGLKGAALMALYCSGGLSSCVYDKNTSNLLPTGESKLIPIDNTVTTTGVSTTSGSNTTTISGTNTVSGINPAAIVNLDLSTNLLSIGNFVSVNNLVIARVANGYSTNSFVVATKTCPHQGQINIYYNSNGFACTSHGAAFDLNGQPTNFVTSNSLKIYSNITIQGNILSVLG